MRLSQLKYLLALLLVTGLFACKDKTAKKQAAVTKHAVVFKGIYSLDAGAKMFKNCADGREFWVADSSAQLELRYSQLVSFEKPGAPVYVEVAGKLSKSAQDGIDAQCDSTITVKKLIKISKDIPDGKCK